VADRIWTRPKGGLGRRTMRKEKRKKARVRRRRDTSEPRESVVGGCARRNKYQREILKKAVGKGSGRSERKGRDPRKRRGGSEHWHGCD